MLIGSGVASEVTGGRFKDGFKMAGVNCGDAVCLW